MYIPPFNNPTEVSSGCFMWFLKMGVLVDARGTVRVVEFAPHHFGLKLATVSSNNPVRIYECLEQSLLATWQLSEEVDVSTLPSVSLSSSYSVVFAFHSRASSLSPTYTSIFCTRSVVRSSNSSRWTAKLLAGITLLADMRWAFAHGICGVGNGVVELLNLGEFTRDSEYRFTLPLLSPSQAAALAWLGLTAQPELLQSPSPPKPGLSWGFQAEPGPHITTLKA
ncbi:uncharacterized protein HD556DRAFT_1471538 [Suillus plorans]|uniref:Uncharacterized protein n=1 Tax=Suillus plorans TaxID=116603 RepID=A0A9P7ATH6_9AGAM|nr:uncharacterized protein HD556DRAFT_1471538 [Suillus plorans]KAG1796051.1 hypothetical protein HD556DRAFT_1471538 [Suillus plorans]